MIVTIARAKRELGLKKRRNYYKRFIEQRQDLGDRSKPKGRFMPNKLLIRVE